MSQKTDQDIKKWFLVAANREQFAGILGECNEFVALEAEIQGERAASKGKGGPTSYTIAGARTHFPDVMGRAHFSQERIDVTRRHKPYAIVISDKEAEKLNRADGLANKFNGIVKVVEDVNAPDATVVVLRELGRYIKIAEEMFPPAPGS